MTGTFSEQDHHRADTALEFSVVLDGLYLTLRAEVALPDSPHQFSAHSSVDGIHERACLLRDLAAAMPATLLQAHDRLHQSLVAAQINLLGEKKDELDSTRRPARGRR